MPTSYVGTFTSIEQALRIWSSGHFKPTSSKRVEHAPSAATDAATSADTMTWVEGFGKAGGVCPFLPPLIFLMLRVLFFAVWFIFNLYAIIQLVTVYDFPMQYYMTKLTSWAALLQCVYLFLAMYSTAVAQCGIDLDVSSTPCYVQLTRMLQTTNLVIQPMVTLLYFGLVHDWDLERGGGARGSAEARSGAGSGDAADVIEVDPVVYSLALTVCGHALNSILAVVDLLISRNRVFLSHCVCATAFAATYMIFTLLYYLAGGTNEDGESRYIYPALDWARSGSTNVLDDCTESRLSRGCSYLTTRLVGTLLILIGVPGMSLLCFMAYLLRRRFRMQLEASANHQHDHAASNVTSKPKTYIV